MKIREAFNYFMGTPQREARELDKEQHIRLMESLDRLQRRDDNSWAEEQLHRLHQNGLHMETKL